MAVPPEYLVAYEEVLRRMEEAGDWRRVAVAAGLQVGYALVRPVHMGRSAFESEGSIVFWLEAYRGKGNARVPDAPSSGRCHDSASRASISEASFTVSGTTGPERPKSLSISLSWNWRRHAWRSH